MRQAVTPRQIAGLFAVSGTIGLAGAGAWFESLMRGARSFGEICGQAHPTGLHCPSCYAALALAFVSTGLLAMAADCARAPAPRAVRRG